MTSNVIEIQSTTTDPQQIALYDMDGGVVALETADSDGSSIYIEMNLTEAKRVLAELAVAIAKAEIAQNA